MTNFTQRCFLASILFVAAFPLLSQTNRSIDGTGNNQSFPEWGAGHTNLLYPGTVGYADGISEPAGAGLPHSRFVSNQLFAQSTLLNDTDGRSAYTWGWGQFIDHDVTFVENHPTEHVDIFVPPFDVFFDPAGTGTAVIPVARSAYDPASGTSTSNFRRHINSTTAFIDASAVYGPDQPRADWLRSHIGGKLKTSSGDMLPWNTTTGEADAPVDPNAPAMDMPFPFVDKLFVAGDFRANENPFLLGIHTLFVREHNRLCDEIANQNPNWTDEQIYQRARKLVGGQIAAITYEEWLPAIGLELPPYDGYKFFAHPGIMNEFSAAAFRYGHTTINHVMMRMDHDGNTMPQGNILLRDAFFNPNATMEVGGVEPCLQGMATVVQQDFDAKVIDDLRNFLFGAPGAGGMDLVAINIQRGRERGLPGYNTLRQNFGLPPVEDFSDINGDPLQAQMMAFVYGEVDNVDPWVGIVSEAHLPGSMFGETAIAIVGQQLEALRNGDRFYYENDPDLTPDDKAWLKQTRLSEVIRRNTGIEHLQENVFFAEPLVSSSNEAGRTAHLSLGIFPNPVAQVLRFSVESKIGEGASFQVSDVQGRTLATQRLQLAPGSNQLAIALPDGAAPGVFVLTMLTESGKQGAGRFLKL